MTILDRLNPDHQGEDLFSTKNWPESRALAIDIYRFIASTYEDNDKLMFLRDISMRFGKPFKRLQLKADSTQTFTDFINEAIKLKFPFILYKESGKYILTTWQIKKTNDSAEATDQFPGNFQDFLKGESSGWSLKGSENFQNLLVKEFESLKAIELEPLKGTD